jgi:hypothetical protein
MCVQLKQTYKGSYFSRYQTNHHPYVGMHPFFVLRGRGGEYGVILFVHKTSAVLIFSQKLLWMFFVQLHNSQSTVLEAVV